MKPKSGKRKNKILKWIKITISIYVLTGIGLYIFQDNFLLHPVSLSADYRFQFKSPFEEKLLQYDSATSFDIVRFRTANDSSRKGAVIYCHGNMENVNHYAGFANNFTKHGYEVWMLDYPGFGKSAGRF